MSDRRRELAVGPWLIRHDPEKTRLLNDEIVASQGSGDRLNCSCIFCRNFRAAPGGPYPEGFLRLLSSLGLGPGDEAKLTEAGPLDDGLHLYHGEFEFVGSVTGESDRPGLVLGQLEVTFHQLPQVIAEGPMASERHSLLLFSCRRPWVLEEPYPPPQCEPPGPGETGDQH